MDPLFCLKNLGGEIGNKRYCINQYGTFLVAKNWTSEQWEGTGIGNQANISILATLWNSMSESDKQSWSKLATRNRTHNYAEFIKYNMVLINKGLEPVTNP
jgi:hypothetical protein